MTEYCDLHTHSVYSDGTYTPEALVREAKKLALKAVALTDHNTLSGVPEFLKAAEGSLVQAIAGIEISTDYGETELHIVGLFLKEEVFEKVENFVKKMLDNKAESNRILVQSLNLAGYKIDYEELKRNTPNGKFNRAHVAGALQKAGYVSSIKEAFDTLLAKDGNFYVQPKRIPVFEAIEFLKSVGAVVILAHPFLNLTEEELRAFLPKAKAVGLDGMETLYSEFDERQTATAVKIAEEFSLKQSGGSDFHGNRKPHIALGKGKGNLFVPIEFKEELEKGV